MRVRPGVVLVLALLCIIALELAVAGLHFTAIQQRRAAGAGSRALQLRLAAQSAAAAALASWPRPRVLALPMGGTLPVPAAGGTMTGRISFGARVERLDSALFLVRAEARSPLQEQFRAGYLVVAVEPAVPIQAALHGGEEVHLQAGAEVTAGSPDCHLTGDPAMALQLTREDRLHRDAAALLTGPVGLAPELEGEAVETILGHPLDELLASAIGVPTAALTPQPVHEAGRCVTELPSNWGEPELDASPCSAWLPQLARAGNLTLHGGRGQGSLYVAGDLVLEAGTSFAGLVLVDGSLTASGGATIDGAAVVRGAVYLQDARIRGNPCAVQAALQAVPALSGPFRPASRSWVPLF